MSSVLNIEVTSDGLSFTAKTAELFGGKPLAFHATTVFDALGGLANAVQKVAEGNENPAAALQRVVREVQGLPPSMRPHEFREAVEKALGL